MRRGRYPDFFLIGAAKAGSTALWQALRHHPDLYFPDQKEPNFFAYKDGRDVFACPSAKALRASWITDEEAYLRAFAGCPVAAKAGEASVSYLALTSCAREIGAAIPDARLIAVLRHPVDRAFSHFQFYRQMGWEPLNNFEAALAAVPGRISSGWRHTYDYMGNGLYGRQISHWLRVFSKKQLLVIFYEDWIREPQDTIAKVCEHLGVEPRALTVTRENTTVSARSQWLKAFIDGDSPILRIARKALPTIARRNLGGLLRQANTVPKLELDAAVRAKLMSYFVSDIRHLEELTERNLSAWLE